MKRRIVSLCSLILSVLILSNGLFAAGEDNVERLSGANRFETMYQIALKLSPGIVNNVVLTSGYGFADALAGVPFAHQKYAPILLVDRNPKADSLAVQYVREHLRVNGNVYILGGTQVISSDCEKVLTSLGIKNENIIRIAGSNRYETSIEIAKNMVHDGSEFYMVSGENFPDALSASVLAAITDFYTAEEAEYRKGSGNTVQADRGGVPVLLVPSRDQTPPSMIEYVNSFTGLEGRQTIHVVGGTGAISESSIGSLKEQINRLSAEGIQRLSGIDRYDTNKKLVLQDGRFDRSWMRDGQGSPVPEVVVASGQGYPDALAGAVLAASMKAPLVLTKNGVAAATSELMLSLYQTNASSQVSGTIITVLGGTGVINQDTITDLDYMLNYGKKPEGSKVSVLAGSGDLGHQNGSGSGASFAFPFAAVEKPNGDIYVSDTNNHLIRVIKPNGTVTTFAGRMAGVDDYGMPQGGFADGTGTEARFNLPKGLATDSEGNLYVADSGNGAIRVISPEGKVSTLMKDLNLPSDLAFREGKLLVTETLKHRILEVSLDGQYEVVAGGNAQENNGYFIGAFADGTGEEAKFNEPVGLAVGPDNHLYIADSGNQRIREISPDHTVTTIAGSGEMKIDDTTYIQGGFQDGSGENASFNFPTGITVGPNGNLYVADRNNHAIRQISGAAVTTLTGRGLHGKQNGYLEQALFEGPCSVTFLNNGNLLVVDQLNHMIRVVGLQ